MKRHSSVATLGMLAALIGAGRRRAASSRPDDAPVFTHRSNRSDTSRGRLLAAAAAKRQRRRQRRLHEAELDAQGREASLARWASRR